MPQTELASLGKRFFGSLIDAAIITIPIVIIVLVILATGLLQDLKEITIVQQYAVGAVFFVLCWGIFVLLNGYWLYTRGQTIGKMLMDTQIVDLNDNIPGLGRILVLRYLLPAIVFEIPCGGSLLWLIDCLFIFGKQRRCVHDYIAGTKVINAKPREYE